MSRPAVTWGPERRQLCHHLNGSQPGSTQAEREKKENVKIVQAQFVLNQPSNVCLFIPGYFCESHVARTWRPGLHIHRHRFVKHHLLDLPEFAKFLSDYTMDWLDNVHTQLMATLHDRSTLSAKLPKSLCNVLVLPW